MKKVIALITIVLLAGLAGCVGGGETADDGPTSDETGESLSTSTYPAEGTDKVWSCIEWEDYNGHKMECELVNSTEGY